METTLIATGFICTALGIGAAIQSRFRRPARSILPILAGLSPWIVMLGHDKILDSAVAAWIFIPLGLILFLISAVAFMKGDPSDSEKYASLLSVIGLVMSMIWLIPFLSAISLSHV